MRLTRIRAADFRNLTFADVSTDAPRVFLLGDNGQGKTNLLEAAALVSSFRSFRTTDIAPLVRCGLHRGPPAPRRPPFPGGKRRGRDPPRQRLA
jgi:recombinational DNA repair ATPase RecF